MSERPAEPHIAVLDLQATGHHPQYLHQLATFWVKEGLAGRFSMIVSPDYRERCDWLVQYVRANREAGLRLIVARELPGIYATDAIGKLRKHIRLGSVLRTQCESLRPDHCVLMHLDIARLPLALDARFSFPVQLSGIYFRPAFHYPHLTHGRDVQRSPLSRLAERLILRAVLYNRHFSHVFCLDPYVGPYIDAMRSNVVPVTLPDGITCGHADIEVAAWRRRFGVRPERRVLLLFGVLDGRKGLPQVLDAFRRLAPAHQRRLCLLLAGPVGRRERDAAYRNIQRLVTETPLQVILQDRYVPDEEVQPLIRVADVVLLPYQRHIGSSNVLLRAALETRPVLGTDLGVVGEHIGRYRLGRSVDASDPAALARALADYADDPASLHCDADQARRLAEWNLAERMARTFFHHLHPAVAASPSPRHAVHAE